MNLRIKMLKSDYDIVANEYNRIAREYDNRWAFYIRATAQETLYALNLTGCEDILDVGCGTGSLLHTILDIYSGVRLTGIDLSIEMLNVAREKLDNRADFVVCRSECLPFQNGKFDVVVSCSSFHYFRLPKAALKEMLRVLMPGGRIIITDWCSDYITCRVVDIFLKLFDGAHYNTYGSKECIRMLQAASCHLITVKRYKVNWLWGLMTAKANHPPM